MLFSQELFEFVSSVSYTESIIYHYRELENSLSHGYKPDIMHIYQTAFEEEERFLTSKHKGKEHWEAYYVRVFQYIGRAIGVYFMNKENNKTELRRFVEFKQMLKSEPYRTAIREVPLKRFVSKSSKIKVRLLRCGLAGVFWTIIKYRRKR